MRMLRLSLHDKEEDCAQCIIRRTVEPAVPQARTIPVWCAASAMP